LADRFILAFAFDYGPVLLRKPFGFHLAVNTLPSGGPFPTGQRDITPAFGYGAPHLGTRGTLTLLILALPGAHCELI